jgi:hypothetical protein
MFCEKVSVCYALWPFGWLAGATEALTLLVDDSLCVLAGNSDQAIISTANKKMALIIITFPPEK